MGLLQTARKGIKRLKNDRLHRRFPATFMVRLSPAEGGGTFEAPLTDWSASGALVASERPFPLHSLLNVDFPPGVMGHSRIRLHGQVVRADTEFKAARSRHTAVMFTDLAESGLAVLRELLLRKATPKL
ncbi:MAG: PilZ domain-containing protein [Pseudomonadota bacterium]